MYQEWLHYLERAIFAAGIPEWGLIHVVDPNDIDTRVTVERYAPTDTQIVLQEQATAFDTPRFGWHRPERKQEMADLRNAMLRRVRYYNPDLFLSLDSDILLSRDSLSGALEGLEHFDAVGPKCYLSKQGRAVPNYASRLNAHGAITREDRDHLAKAQVLMAIKLMSPAAYKIDYNYHVQGEDIGWSINCKRAGVILAFDGRYPSKHIWSPDLLHEWDRRCGF